MIKSVLIANRGEIARRIIRSLRRLQIQAYVIYDSREKDSLYVKEADQAYSLGSGPLSDTFLAIDRILAIARRSGCDAIHPGYGFLAERADFAEACRDESILFIGPGPEAIRKMGNKLEAIRLAKDIGIPVIPGFYGDPATISGQIEEQHFPCLIKAAAGGGGKAMHIVETRDELPFALEKSAREALKYFGDAQVYVEKYLERPRHIEVQLLADNHGQIVHLFERECTLQRRYQKVIEEAPAVSVDQGVKENLYRDAIRLAREVNYVGAGTVEFLVDSKGRHYFLEMNTRIQVEHPVTEAITGVDIVGEQLNIANGKTLSDSLSALRIRGHALEARLYAEDPEAGFIPSPGEITGLRLEENKDLRIESCLQVGESLLSDFDPMLAKFICRAENRTDAIRSMQKALEENFVQGTATNRSFLLGLLEEKNFLQNTISTHFISENLDKLLARSGDPLPLNRVGLAGLLISLQYREIKDSLTPTGLLGYWRMNPSLQVEVDGQRLQYTSVRMVNEKRFEGLNEGRIVDFEVMELTPQILHIVYHEQDIRIPYSWNEKTKRLYFSIGRKDHELRRLDWLDSRNKRKRPDNLYGTNGNSLVKAPLSGLVVKVNYRQDDSVSRGESILVIESMKMENEIRLPYPGRILEMFTTEGKRVNEGDILFRVESKGE